MESGFRKSPPCRGNLNLNWGQGELQGRVGQGRAGLWSEAGWEQQLVYETDLLRVGAHWRTRVPSLGQDWGLWVPTGGPCSFSKPVVKSHDPPGPDGVT